MNELNTHPASARLRSLADTLDAAVNSPDEDVRTIAEQIGKYVGPTLTFYATTRDKVVSAALAKLARAHGAVTRKRSVGNYLQLTSTWGDSYNYPVNLTMIFDREAVCTRTVIGQETYIDRVPVGGYKDVESTRDVIEWECDPILNVKADNEV